MKRFLQPFTAAVTASLIFISACTKIDTTTVGQGLIPPVDGVTTLATDTFAVTTELGLFTDTSIALKNDDYFLGQLTGDGRFGNTDASVYMQFKPTLRFAWKNKKDSIALLPNEGFDSAVLCLAYNEAIYGDSLTPMNLEVRSVDDTSNFSQSVFYKIAPNPNVGNGNIVFNNDFSITPASLSKDTFKVILKRDTMRYTKMLRIKLNTGAAKTFFQNFLKQDTSNGSALFDNKSFTNFMKGFVIRPRGAGGRTLMNFSLINANTRLEVWYRVTRNGVVDTTFDSFGFNQFPAQEYRCASINWIDRQRAGATMNNYLGAGNDSLLFIHSTPGSYAIVRFPTIKNFPNKMIHRAELIFQEDPLYKNNIFTPPSRLYLDAVVTNFSKFKAVPFDFYLLNPLSGPADFGYFGGDLRQAATPSGGPVQQYSFNVTKYVQGMITRGDPYYDMRVYAPFDTRYYSQQATTDYYDNGGLAFPWPIITRTAFGGVVLGGGNHSQYRVKLRLVYSNI